MIQRRDECIRRGHMRVLPRRKKREGGAPRHESGVSEGELSAETVDQLQSDGQDRVEADEHDDAEVVAIDQLLIFDEWGYRDDDTERREQQQVRQGRTAERAAGGWTG